MRGGQPTANNGIPLFRDDRSKALRMGAVNGGRVKLCQRRPRRREPHHMIPVRIRRVGCQRCFVNRPMVGVCLAQVVKTNFPLLA